MSEQLAPVFACAVAVAALLAAEDRGIPWLRAVAKLSAASAFVWAGVRWGALESAFGQWVMVGLLLCWVGDALLLPAGRGKAFQLGIGSFLLGHLAYAVGCLGLPLGRLALIGAMTVMGVVAWRTLAWLGPHVPDDFRWPVRAYITVISVMVVLACGAVGGGASIWLGIGAVGFALSDLSVARDRFVAPGFVNGAWGLPAYFFSQLAIAYSASAA